MAETACHAFASTTQVGLTQVLGAIGVISMRLLLGTLLLVGFSAATSAGELGRPTADAVSTFTFSGVKSALMGASNIPDGPKRCMSNLDNRSLSDTYLPLLTQRFSASKLSALDSFFSSSLGQKYLAAFVASPAQAGYVPGLFSEKEVRIIYKTMNDPEFMAFARDANPGVPGPARDRALQLMQSCRDGA